MNIPKKSRVTPVPTHNALSTLPSLLIIDHMLCYFDEIDLYNTLVVNNDMSMIVKRYMLANDRGPRAFIGMGDTLRAAGRSWVSLLSNWFFERMICCVCHQSCTTLTYNQLGMYCHIGCIPVMRAYYDVPGEIIKHVGDHVSAGTSIKYLFDTNNPCVKNISMTCAGHNRINSPICYEALDKAGVDKAVSDMYTYVKQSNKMLSVYNTVGRLTSVRVGTATINVHDYFGKANPGYKTRYTTTKIISGLLDMYKKLRTLHTTLTDHYRRDVRPKLYLKAHARCSTWAAFLRYVNPDLRNYRLTVAEFYQQTGAVDDPLSICRYIDSKVDYVNTKLIHHQLSKFMVGYYKVHRDYNTTLASIKAPERMSEMMDLFVSNFSKTDDYQHQLDNNGAHRVYSAVLHLLKNVFKERMELMIRVSGHPRSGRDSFGIWLHKMLIMGDINVDLPSIESALTHT
jgi:hypothetical protein